MSQQGMVINSLEFARQQNTLSGRLEPNALPRLADILFDAGDSAHEPVAKGRIEFRLTGVAAENIGGARSQEHALMLEVDGVLQLVCQRCLGALDYPVCIRKRLFLMKPGASWSDDQLELEDDGNDEIEASRELQVAALVEEEILLALPIAPRHESCVAPGNTAASREISPFEKLAQLKRS